MLETSSNKDIHKRIEIPDFQGQNAVPECGLPQCIYKDDAQPLSQLQWGLFLFPYVLGGGGVSPHCFGFAGIKCFSSKMR